MGRAKKEPKVVEPDNDGNFPRDWVNDPIWLRDLIHRTYNLLPKNLAKAFGKSDPEDVAALVSDLEYMYAVEEERGYEIPSDGPDDEEDEEDDDGNLESDEDEEDEDE